MAKILFQKDINQDALISGLQANKVALSTYNSAMNDISIKFSDMQDAYKDADDAVTKHADDIVQALIDGAVTDNANAIATLNGDSTVDGSVDKKVADAVTAMVNGAPEAYDTLQELLTLIDDDADSLTNLINNVKSALSDTVGDASDDWNTLAKIEIATKAIRDDIQDQLDHGSEATKEVMDAIPHYKYDDGLAISSSNGVTLTLIPSGDIVGGKATVYSVDDDTGDITIQAILTLSKDTSDDASAKAYIIDSDDDLSSYKASVEYFYNNGDNA